MKKFLMSVSVVAATCLVMSSCLKNNNDNYVAPVDPSVEAPELQSFIDSTGYTDQNTCTHGQAYRQTCPGLS